jgi:hypothetical protein
MKNNAERTPESLALIQEPKYENNFCARNDINLHRLVMRMLVTEV